ncbi:hypothetical protein BS78_05G067700 [Paspalum vaginatum]|nr:hypothetical protein BS78_05G067700 [Paspalum vaginatum]
MAVPPDKDNPPVTGNNSLQDKGKDVIARRVKLKLPRGDGKDGTHAVNDMTMGKQDVQDISSSRQRDRPIDFTPPEINLMKFVECDDEQNPSRAQDDTNGKQEKTFLHDEPVSSNSYDQIDEEILKAIEDNAIHVMKLKESKEGDAQASSSKRNNNTIMELDESKEGDAQASSSKRNNSTVMELEESKEGNAQASRSKRYNSTVAEPSELAATDPSSVNLSVTPAYRPPNNMLKKPTVLRSPFIDTTANHFKCNKLVCDVYNAICDSGGRSTRSTSSSKTVEYAIRPCCFSQTRGELSNTVAEARLYAINPRSRNAKKHVLPLRISTFLQSSQIDRKEVTRVFSSARNHLDHRDLVMFPVLQDIKRTGYKDFGHYFLLVLNLRCNRFEVLDSWRGPDNDVLRTCCNIIIERIKALWKLHYPDSNKDIDSFNPVHIIVPQQNNNYDCGFHVLLHAEYWDGRSVLNFNDKDMQNVSKLLTYKWLIHRSNDADWKAQLRI